MNNKPRILIGCEESARVRDAFRIRGHDAYSNDLLGSRGDSAWHITGDVFKAIKQHGPWDLGIFFPPCTHVCVSGARWWPKKLALQREALEFMRDLLESNIPRIAMENPVGAFSTYWRKPDQIVQPWMFGCGETKATCLWLKGLPPLVPRYRSWREYREAAKLPTDAKPIARIHKMPPGPNRARDRSVTYQEIADAMAEQWGAVLK
jgi:hypothetical protein